MEVICKLYLKLLQTSDKSIINKIIDKLYLQYSAEKVILNNYYINVLDWYYNNVIGPNFKKLYN